MNMESGAREEEQEEEGDAGQCGPRHSKCRISRSHHASSRASSRAKRRSGGGGAPSGHKHVTLPMLEKAICQLGERQGSSVSNIRTVLASHWPDQAPPPACCVKKALLKGVRQSRIKRAHGFKVRVAPTHRRPRKTGHASPGKSSAYSKRRVRRTGSRRKSSTARKSRSKNRRRRRRRRTPQKAKHASSGRRQKRSHSRRKRRESPKVALRRRRSTKSKSKRLHKRRSGPILRKRSRSRRAPSKKRRVKWPPAEEVLTLKV